MKKNLGKRIATIATASVLAVSAVPFNVLAYNEYDTSTDTFSTDTDNNADYTSWRTGVWDAGASADTGKIALTPGKTETELNFAWYSVTKGTPAVKIWEDGKYGSAKVIKGTVTEISSVNNQGSTYEASNKVTATDLVEGTTYYYQYTDNYVEDGTTNWSNSYKYEVQKSASFSVILTGDPQVGASASGSNSSDIARDTYNWNKTMQQALITCPDAAFLLSAGDQIDTNGTSDTQKKTRESEYAGYLYPSVFRSLPIAATIGNHDMSGVEYTYHFNNPNASELGETDAGGDYYFSYGDVLFISLNSNNRNQEEHRQLLTEAVNSNEDAKWKVVIFHSDIYGSGAPHADTDATANRIILAPLMDEFDIDICLTGHDHTYSRSYQVLDGNVVDYDISDGTVTNPEGTLYITTGSGSGSKYYNLLSYTPYYIAERTNEFLPSFSTIDFTEDSLTLKTYNYNGGKYADDFTIIKTDSEISVDEAIEKAQTKLSEIDKTKYTEESINALETSLAKLIALKATYTTAEDGMISQIVTDYAANSSGGSYTIVSGYGTVVGTNNKDNGKNRFKSGLSTLLDKTIYAQNFANVTEYSLNAISSEELENAKNAVVTAVADLTLVNNQEAITNGTGENATNINEETTGTTGIGGNESAPQTGDNTFSKIAVCAATLLIGAGAVLALRKKDDSCE